MVFELQQRALDELRAVRESLRDLTRGVGRIEESVAHGGVAQAQEASRIDRLTERVERIETRLELRD